jgi:DnaK suppressor protein
MDNLISSNLPQGYDPLKDPNYMSPDMRCYFQEQLTELLENLEQEEDVTSLHQEEEDRHIRSADYVDVGKEDEAQSQAIQFLDHEETLKHEAEDALQRIEMGTYGYCEETQEPIGVKRLMAFPTARYTVQIQQGKEDLSS